MSSTNIVQHKRLAVKDEYLLYNILCEFISNNQLSKLDIFKLMENVRFRWLTFDQLQIVIGNSITPRTLVIEALMCRLQQHENGGVRENYGNPENLLPIRLQPRPKFSITFSLNRDNSNFFKGIIGWIATNCGQEEWQNPHKLGRVKVHSPTLSKGNWATLVDKESAEIWTQDMPNMWFSIDLRRLILPSAYSLRHGGNWKADAIRTWDLQGSVDGVNWVTLRRHTNDSSLNSPFAVHSWTLPETKEAYRHFRIFQTGRNSSNRNFLVISGFEFFGTLYDNV
eukprot:TRINITY_DN4110_c0_g1_i1.p1 TRINITY_DN4110_c0_g1~~TRINITY_DN4110_c0_g1_i1.p1  ORF type:complete len:282 (+),score=26.06 TRINITY_DN4110_c0_g1_i1:162-1007(+)